MRAAAARGTAALLALLQLLLVAPACAAGQVLTFVALDNDSEGAPAKAHEAFVDAVRQSTGGRITITMDHAPNAIDHAHNPSRSQKAALQTGKMAIAEVRLDALIRDSGLYAITNVPFFAFGFDEAEQLIQIARPHISARLAEEGLVLLYLVQEPPVGLFAVKEIGKVGDLKGLKTIATPSTQRILELTGSVSLMGAAHDKQRLDLRWDSVENIPLSIGSQPSNETGASHTWAAMRIFYDLQHQRGLRAVLASRVAFDALPTADRNVLGHAARTAERAAAVRLRGQHAVLLSGPGFTEIALRTAGPELVAGLRKIGNRMAEEWAIGTGADGFAILNAFRRRNISQPDFPAPPR